MIGCSFHRDARHVNCVVCGEIANALDLAIGSADLLEVIAHHDKMAAVRRRDVEDTRTLIRVAEKDEWLRPEGDWEEVKSFNLRQADFDEEWVRKHERFAAAIRALLPQNSQEAR